MRPFPASAVVASKLYKRIGDQRACRHHPDQLVQQRQVILPQRDARWLCASPSSSVISCHVACRSRERQQEHAHTYSHGPALHIHDQRTGDETRSRKPSDNTSTSMMTMFFEIEVAGDVLRHIKGQHRFPPMFPYPEPYTSRLTVAKITAATRAKRGLSCPLGSGRRLLRAMLPVILNIDQTFRI